MRHQQTFLWLETNKQTDQLLMLVMEGLIVSPPPIIVMNQLDIA